MKIYDCFTFFNEKELLELRINLLKDIVDRFIIVEADRTHTGNTKRFICNDLIEQLSLPKDKIQVVELSLPSKEDEPNDYVRENLQRDEIAKYIDYATVAIISDCDEIINPEFIKYYASIIERNANNILRIPMFLLSGRADLRVYDEKDSPRMWAAGYLCLRHHLIRYSASEIRQSYTMQKHDLIYKDIYAVDGGVVQEAGWHFNWMGDADRLKLKYKSFMHYDDVIERAVDKKDIDSFIDSYQPKDGATDPLGRDNHILKKFNVTQLPKILFSLPRVKNFLLPGTPEKKFDHIYDQPQFGEEWFTFPQLYSSMIDKFDDGSKFVEVGSWKGKSSAYMAVEIANSGKKIDFYCVDTWMGSAEHQENFKKDLETLYDTFLSNMKDLSEYFIPLKLDSLSAAKKFKDQSLDFVFIDADHSYESAKQDILAWWPKIKEGGILAGHDCYPDQPEWGGVYRAVKEIFEDFEIKENCFVVKK